jgi:hypothetical protein
MARRYGKAGQEHAEVEAFSEKATASRAILEADSVPALKDAMARPKALFISGSVTYLALKVADANPRVNASGAGHSTGGR